MHLPAWLQSLPSNILGSIVGTVLVAGAVAVWSSMRFSWPDSVGVFIASFVFILFAINQLTEYFERAQRRARNTASPAQIAAQVRNWLSQLQYGPQDVPQQNFNFVFLCRDFYQHPFHVFQATSAPKMMGIVTWIEVNEQQQRALDRNPALLATMRMEMARMGVLFTGIEPPVKKMTARMDLPWSEFLTDYVLRLGIDHIFRARAILSEMALLEFAKERIEVAPVAQPQLPEPKEQPKPEQGA